MKNIMANPEEFNPESDGIESKEGSKAVKIEMGGITETFTNRQDAIEYLKQMREDQD